MMRIIDNKQVDLTDQEWEEYQKICKSYDSPTREGRFLFQGLFSSNDKGIITSLHSPKQVISLEIYLFIASVMQHQHIRLMYEMMSGWKKEMEEQFSQRLLAAVKEVSANKE